MIDKQCKSAIDIPGFHDDANVNAGFDVDMNGDLSSVLNENRNVNVNSGIAENIMASCAGGDGTLNVSETARSADCTPSVRPNAPMNTEHPNVPLSGRITEKNQNVWNRPKFVEFTDIDDAVELARGEGPVKIDVQAVQANIDKLKNGLIVRTILLSGC